VRLLHATIAGEASPRGERTRELGKQAHECINADINVDDPNTPSCASHGTYKLANKEGEELTNAWNIQQLHRFYP
jgi:hypothetical protein